MYDITVPNEVENIADTLLNDEEFAKHDNDKNQRWRSGSIIHYVCFIKARSYFMNEITNVNTPYDDGKKDGLEEKEVIAKPSSSLQQIFYGAPGTGKSYEINDLTKAYSTIRTTFHPDSDYSTFVGAYKPTMEETPVYGVQGFEVAKEKRITYTFVKQAFLKAYLGAWQKYANGNETAEPQFLVIEEINRGNCAQIFGDLFQLLDRSDNGFSTYPIEADSDLQNEIKKAFAEGGEYAIENGLDVDDAVDGYTSNYGETLSDDIKNGRVLLLPNNLYIWATMNTSDQSLFPIDSAFKRRWDWRYVKIADAGKGWKIRCGNEYCD
ncbi:AAA family ATPase [Prevotella bivia]|nr:AAA family ATPase [Prevotella bivia]